MFNPEGVKGKTAQPPHKIFNFMAKYSITRDKQLSENHTVSVAVKTFDCIEDALDTMYRQARRHGYEVTIDNTPDGSWGRAKTSAKRKAIRAAMDSIHRHWRESIYTQYCVFGNHGLTAKQLWWLVDEGLIVEPNDKVVEVKTCECTGWMS